MTREEIEAKVSVRLGVLLHAGTNAAAIETFADLIERVRDEAVDATREPAEAPECTCADRGDYAVGPCEVHVEPAPTDPSARARELREELAALAHAQWSGWMEYMLRRLKQDDAEEWIARWTRQMSLAYSELREDERESDRREADRYIAVFDRALADERERAIRGTIEAAVMEYASASAAKLDSASLRDRLRRAVACMGPVESVAETEERVTEAAASLAASKCNASSALFAKSLRARLAQDRGNG